MMNPGGRRAWIDDIHIVAGLPNMNADKFCVDDSVLWEMDEDVIAR